MSFSREVKEEILDKLALDTSPMRRAFISSIFRMLGSIEITRSNRWFRLEVESAELLLAINNVFEEEYGTSLSFDMGSLDETDTAKCFVAKLDYDERILIDTGILIESNGDIVFSEGIGLDLASGEEVKAYIIGSFLSSGGVYIPSEKKHSGYHLEIVFKEEDIASELACMLAEFDIFMKKVERGEEFVLYIKEHGMICDTLALLGATKCYFRLQELIIERSENNNANRHGNCSAANALKVADAGIKHILAIQYIKDHGAYDTLSPKLKAVAELRTKYPNTPLLELAGLMDPPITKSGINHRLTKILAIADELRRKNGDE